MKNLLALFVGLFIFSFQILRAVQEPVWKGEIVHEDGMEVIKNPAEPLYGEIHYHKPHFRKILADGEWIFVEHFKSPQDQSEARSMDVFNTQGFYLHKCTFPLRPKIIRDGFAYLIETSEETGDVRVKRFRIKNWDQLKKR